MQCSRTQSALYWLAACAVALSSHMAIGAALLMTRLEVEDEAPAGALVTELAPVFTTTPSPPQTLAQGPPATDSAESAPSTPPPEPVKEETRESVQAEISPAEPEVAVSQPPPKEQKPAEAPAQNVPDTQQRESAASSASVAAAPPKMDAPEAEKAVAPSLGLSPAAQRARATWHRTLSMHLERFKRYPKGSTASGTVIVEFTVTRDGRIGMRSLHQSSSAAILDDAALDLLTRASPVPAPPKDGPQETITLRVPIIYKK